VNTRGLNIPFVSFGNVTSDDLFCEKEQALFDLYEKWGHEERYVAALDIGANIGVHSCLMVRAGMRVDAFEPDAEHFRLLRQNLSAYDKVKWSVYNAAVSDRNGTAVFVRVKDNTTGSHLKGDKSPYGETEEIPVRVMDCRPWFAWANFAKIDCEGHEARLLTTVMPDCRCEFLVEVGTLMNAEAIFNHFRIGPYRMWAQRSGWGEVKGLAEMPMHHSHGALFIGRSEP
jgi:FkbM family methyltransferase